MSKPFYYAQVKKLEKILKIPAERKYIGSTKKYWKDRLTSLRARRSRSRARAALHREIRQKFSRNVHWVATFSLNNQTGLIKQGDIKLRPGQKSRVEAMKDFEASIDEYKGEAEDVKLTTKTTKILKRSIKESRRQVKRQRLKALIYSLPNLPVDDGYEKYCMVDYVLQYANKRKGNNKKLDRMGLMKLLNRDDPEKGISCEEVEELADTLKINVTCCMIDNTYLINKRHDTAFGNKKHKNTPHLMFYVSNGHCYPVESSSRMSFADKAREGIKYTKVEGKTPKQKTITRTDAIEDIIEQSIYGGPKENFIIQAKAFTSDSLLAIMKKLNIQFTFSSNSKKDIKKLRIGNTNIIAIDNIKDTKKVCKNLNVDFDGKTISTVIMDDFNKKYKLHKSEYNDKTLDIIDNLNLSPHHFRFNGTENLEEADLKAIDISKCYTSCMVKDQEYPIFSVFDYPEAFLEKAHKKSSVKGGLKGEAPLVGLYYIETENQFPLMGNSWYSHVTVKYALENNIITKDNIKYQLISQYKTTNKDFKEFQRNIYKMPTTIAKKCINSFIGGLNLKQSKNTKHYVTNSRTEAIMLSGVGESSHFYDPIRKLHTITTKGEANKMISNANHKPIYNQIIEQGRLAIYELAKKVGLNNCVAIKTDCVIFKKIPLRERKQNIKFGVKPGCYRMEKVKNIPVCRLSARENIYTYIHEDIKDWNEGSLSDKNLCIDGYAGTGKSYLINNELDKNAQRLAFTNTAANNINGKTLHGYFKMSMEDDTCNLNNHKAEDIIIDEYSMVPDSMFSILTNLKMNYPETNIILSGDSRQIQFIPKECSLNKPIPRMMDTYAFRSLTNFNKVELTKCHRADERFAHDIKDGLFRKHANCNITMDSTDTHVVITNRKRDRINSYKYNKCENKKYLTFKTGTPWIAKDTIKKLGIVKNTFYTLQADKKNKCLVMTSEAQAIPLNKSQVKTYFELRYAMTINKLQGHTIKEKYLIHEWDHIHNTREKAYTSCSRATKSCQYGIC